MPENEDIQKIITECRTIAKTGLGNGIHATIPELIIDVVKPPNDFLGINGNPAIFVNKHTYDLLGHLHSNWVVNQTIALKHELLNHRAIEIIGVIIHETGHAFNVAANIVNSETNSYIFEIEVLLQLLKTKNTIMKSCSMADVLSYFNLRLDYYKKGAKDNNYLQSLIEQVHQFQAENKLALSGSLTRRFNFFAANINKVENGVCGSFFTIPLAPGLQTGCSFNEAC